MIKAGKGEEGRVEFKTRDPELKTYNSKFKINQ